GRIRVARSSLQQAGEPTVGERFPARLAGGAVLEAAVGEEHAADRVAAHQACLTPARVYAESGALGILQIGGRLPGGGRDRLAERALDGLVQSVHRIGVEVAGR